MAKKIINDPVYGFVTVPSEIALRIIDHPWFQRLRHIRQLGLSHYVYPGALHTRFHHALGAMHLMHLALEAIRSKGHDISDAEAEASILAILLHDIGHGPFSHALEHVLIADVSHEEITKSLLHRLNAEVDGALAMAIDIFENQHAKPFLHQLVSSQLDVDRLDYLTRDSFFTGVSEGVVGYDRIIKMLNVHDGQLVVEQKGIYSIEKFLIARRLMYWQVYLHKTVLVTELMVRGVFKRVADLVASGRPTAICSAALSRLATSRRPLHEALNDFLEIDDHDVMVAIKQWQESPDTVLAHLCHGLIRRRLLRIEWRNQPVSEDELAATRSEVAREHGLSVDAASYLVFGGSTQNHAYEIGAGRIGILYKDGRCLDISEATDLGSISSLTEPVVKFYLCRPKSRVLQ